MGLFRWVLNGIREELVADWKAGRDDTLSDGNPASQARIDHLTAMKYSAVSGCVRVLAETKAVVPAKIYRTKDDGTREERNDIPLYDILHNEPNDEMSTYDFESQRMVSLNTGGYSVCERIQNRRGELIGLYPQKWDNVRIGRSKETNKLQYLIRSGTKWETLDRKDVFHVVGLSFDGITGLSPIEYQAGAIMLGLNYEKFGNAFYKNGANTNLAILHPGKLDDTAFERLKADIAKNYAGTANTGKPMLFEDGVQLKELTIKPADAQLIELKRFSIEDVARWYRVPLHLLQDLSRSTNNNIEHQSLEFIMYTMLPWFKRDEAAMRQQLLTQKERQAGYYVEYKIDALLRGDAKSRAEAYAVGRQWGWLSVNDIRRLENMPPIPNGDVYLQPVNMMEAGKEPVADENTKRLAEQLQAMLEGR